MKIHQLPPGARFIYEGEEYVKTGPMFGTGKGGQRLFPRHVVLTVLGEHEPKTGKSEKRLAARAVTKAFEDFFESCKSLVAEEKQVELNAARERFLKALR